MTKKIKEKINELILEVKLNKNLAAKDKARIIEKIKWIGLEIVFFKITK